MGLLDGKTALITGASRGIGKAIALKYASEGADIAFTDVVIDENTVAELETWGHKVRAYVSDASSFQTSTSTGRSSIFKTKIWSVSLLNASGTALSGGTATLILER